MRISTLAIVACSAVLMTAGCMTDDSMAKSSSQAISPFEDNIDYEKVNRVNAQAAQGGYGIVWVHLPTKKSRQSRSEKVGIN